MHVAGGRGRGGCDRTLIASFTYNLVSAPVQTCWCAPRPFGCFSPWCSVRLEIESNFISTQLVRTEEWWELGSNAVLHEEPPRLSASFVSALEEAATFASNSLGALMGVRCPSDTEHTELHLQSRLSLFK